MKNKGQLFIMGHQHMKFQDPGIQGFKAGDFLPFSRGRI